MTIFELAQKYDTEDKCRLDFKERREEAGIKCCHCGCTKHYWLKAKFQWQCSGCDYRLGLRKGTFMEHSKLPFLIWYRAMILISFSKKGLSSMEIQRQLGKNRYESTWSMIHKIRAAMGKANSKERLSGTVEFDEGYFRIRSNTSKPKRGRGSQNTAKVAVMVESFPLENAYTGQKYYKLGKFKMEFLEGHEMNKVDELLLQKVSTDSVLITDKSTSYNRLKDSYNHFPSLSDEHIENKTMKWVHIAISNAKRKLLGLNHSIKKKYIQNYFDEFCFKLNRRDNNQTLLDNLIHSVCCNYW